MYSSAAMIKEAENRIKMEMQRLNRKPRYKDKGVVWSLQYECSVRGYDSYIEISYTPSGAGQGPESC